MISISGTDINGCDCPGEGEGSIPISGVLIDGVIPSIDTTRHGSWASELFVVNRTSNERDSIKIGFQFSNEILLRSVEIAYLDCLIWGIGLTAVNVFSSNVTVFLLLICCIS